MVGGTLIADIIMCLFSYGLLRRDYLRGAMEKVDVQ